MGFLDLFKKPEALLAIDVGVSSIKLVELDLNESRPMILNLAIAKQKEEVFSNNVITRPDEIGDQIRSMLDANEVEERKIVTAVPGPAVFTKRIKLPKVAERDLAETVMMEAGNLIPHSIDAVRLDYQVLGQFGKNQLDVLIVAVKNEIIDSFIETFSLAGLETAVVDVDYFALQNIFEVCYPDMAAKTVALINIGARYSSINICRAGQPIFTGDIGVGGKVLTDSLVEGLGISREEVEQLKSSGGLAADSSEGAKGLAGIGDIVDRNVEYVATEFNRQLSFFWNAAGADEGIDTIVLTGGGCLVPGLAKELSEKTGIESFIMDPLRGIDAGGNIDQTFLKENAAALSVALGLGIRETGDKPALDFD